MGGVGVWGLGVRVRMRGVFTTTNPLSRFFILWLGVASNFPVSGPKLAKKRMKNWGNRNDRKKSEKVDLSS